MMTSRILSLREAVTVEELQNDEEYNDIVEDMREECSKVRASLCLISCDELGALRGCSCSLYAHVSCVLLRSHTYIHCEQSLSGQLVAGMSLSPACSG